MRAAGSPWWGWHRLHDGSARRLVADAGVGPGDLVLDVGAGTGAITAPLIAAGARVVAVELHPRRADHLRRRFGHRGVVVVAVDASDLRLPRRPFRVVANPPFGVATALLRRLLAPGSRLERADLVLPRHVVRRWTSADAPGRHRWSSEFTLRPGRPLPRRAFAPPPPVDAAVLVIERRACRRERPTGRRGRGGYS